MPDRQPLSRGGRAGDTDISTPTTGISGGPSRDASADDGSYSADSQDDRAAYGAGLDQLDAAGDLFERQGRGDAMREATGDGGVSATSSATATEATLMIAAQWPSRRRGAARHGARATDPDTPPVTATMFDWCARIATASQSSIAAETARTLHPMKQSANPNPLRLRKRHGTGERKDITVDDGARIVAAQAVGRSMMWGILAIFIFCPLWIALSSLLDRVFPWMTVLLGGLIGIAVRRGGRGVDWRFPAIAAGLALAGALIANVVLAASVTADEFGTGTVDILRAATGMTWPVFFGEVMNAADGFYAAVAAGIAAFLANRRLDRSEYYALRIYRDGSDRHQ